MYRAGAITETSAWDEALMVQGVGVVSTGAFLDQFNPAEACWASLQE